jgi:hypothetical protein
VIDFDQCDESLAAGYSARMIQEGIQVLIGPSCPAGKGYTCLAIGRGVRAVDPQLPLTSHGTYPSRLTILNETLLPNFGR